LEHYGYLGLFGLLVLGIVGLPLPDETLLTFVGVLIDKGHMSYPPAFLAAFFGSAVGITMSYSLGRVLGRRAVKRLGRFLHLTEERLLKVERYMERYGRFALFFGYFVPGLRHLTALTAGFGKMNWRIFAPYAYGGALIWVMAFLLLGQTVGHEWHRIEETLYPFRYWIGALVVLSLGTPFLWRFLVLRRIGQPGAGEDFSEQE
jgi:membrane protein DedA with SNARE-associated domain